MITEDDVDLFTRGGCLVLAEMISEQTGWPICALNTVDEPDEPDVHAFVRAPDGLYLDIEGKHTGEELMGRYSCWSPTGITQYDPEDFPGDWLQKGEASGRFYERRAGEV